MDDDGGTTDRHAVAKRSKPGEQLLDGDSPQSTAGYERKKQRSSAIYIYYNMRGCYLHYTP